MRIEGWNLENTYINGILREEHTSDFYGDKFLPVESQNSNYIVCSHCLLPHTLILLKLIYISISTKWLHSCKYMQQRRHKQQNQSSKG